MANERPSTLRCAIYTRKSSEEGLEQSFNSLDAQREACEAYILSQRHEGWLTLDTRYDDGGFSGGSMARPALQALMQDIEAGKIDSIVVYKVDRLTRALSDFAKMVDLFDAKNVSFVSVTQQFNTTTSMGRLTLNVLLSFAQFEREVTGERIRDKIAASKKKGMWMGGRVPVGYDAVERKLIVNPVEAMHVVHIFEQYLALGCVAKLKAELDLQKNFSKIRISRTGKTSGGQPYSRGALYELLQNRLYIGDTMHRDRHYPGEHAAIIPMPLWDKVQAKMQDNVQGHRSGSRAKEPSLLVGMAYDGHDRRLTPSHTVKRGKRYRYYVSHPGCANATSADRRAVRIPAQDLENVVITRIHLFLTSHQTLLDALASNGLDANDQNTLMQAACKHVEAWPAAAPTTRRQFLQAIVKRVTVKDETIDITLNSSSLRDALLPMRTVTSNCVFGQEESRTSENAIVLTVDARLARCGLEVRLILAGEETKDKPSRISQSLVKAIARGRSWYEQLISLEKVKLTDLAAASGVNDRYASRILRSAFLAPDIVEAILDGRQPTGITLDKMLDDLPLGWAKQRQRFGF
ncbi:Site-specific DNA recombinase [Collimonas sp. OK307]|uniref:recombinase family protein n=1 Tax=Collimonas sp. OK307 TaxID=1801620 RepID=UPI0008E70196|nr:recombinase family protein [Collimonas sp. OK307]SFI32782.1 Site-specific DNA recombinase [Collimonas sp. OK307]